MQNGSISGHFYNEQVLYVRKVSFKSKRSAVKKLLNSKGFTLIPLTQSKRYQCTKSRTNITLNSFYPKAIRLLNKAAK